MAARRRPERPAKCSSLGERTECAGSQPCRSKTGTSSREELVEPRRNDEDSMKPGSRFIESDGASVREPVTATFFTETSSISRGDGGGSSGTMQSSANGE